ncbi:MULTISPECIES: hypothetical protein [Helicobacter]|uniref:Uncharacterized protein n=1 Tax=Helicobacter ibis TaxID=2962633 RepID=A0ABT4VCQ9_9HELI|nr:MULTISPECIES: hypothetical protein [Helicobacter]MDA3967356.1 hypothetical protein [Helicobacter sp. WB40]MDA3968492.1 hypothetical protein [Helicobacter ibis]
MKFIYFLNVVILVFVFFIFNRFDSYDDKFKTLISEGRINKNVEIFMRAEWSELDNIRFDVFNIESSLHAQDNVLKNLERYHSFTNTIRRNLEKRGIVEISEFNNAFLNAHFASLDAILKDGWYNYYEQYDLTRSKAENIAQVILVREEMLSKLEDYTKRLEKYKENTVLQKALELQIHYRWSLVYLAKHRNNFDYDEYEKFFKNFYGIE